MERALISGKLICEEKDRTPSIGGGTVFFGVMPAVPIHILQAAAYGLIQSLFSEYPEDKYNI